MILNSPTISGSLTVTGNIITSGSITISGSIASASYATNADLLDGLDSTAFATTGAYSATSASLYSTSASLSATSGSLSTASGSFNTRVTALEATGSALSSSLLTVSGSGYATSASLSTDSGSFNSRVATIESKYATTGSNNFRAPQYVSDTTVPTGFSNTTGSIYTDGGIQVTKDSYFSGSMFIKGNLTIYGTQSVAYITSSQLNIATNLITVNTATPSVRFGGLAVYDSGSTGTGATGSLLWDSQNNGWVYQRESGSTYAGGMLISGPRRALGSNLGDEQGLTACMIPVAQGGDHITSSLIYHDSTVTCIPNTLKASIGCFANNITTNSPGGGVNSATFNDRTGAVGAAVDQYGTLAAYSGILNSNGAYAAGSSGTALVFNAGAVEQFRISATNMTVVGNVTAGAKFETSFSNTNTSFDNNSYVRLVNTGTSTLNQRVDLILRWADGTYNGTGGISMVRESATARSGKLVLQPIGSDGNNLEALTLASTGAATFACQVNAESFYTNDTRYISNQIMSGYNANSEDSDIWINYTGYLGGTTRFRDFRIGNGKQGQIAFFDGSTGVATFACTVCAASLKAQSGFADLVLCGSNTTSPHIGGTFTITTNQDGNGRTIIGNAAVGRAMYLEAGGTFTFLCAATFSGNALTVSGDNPALTVSTSNASLYSYIALTGGTSSNYIYTLANSYNTTGPYVAGALTLVGTTSGGISIAAQCASGLIRFYTCATERMRINSNGVVLINNTYTSPYGVLNTYNTPVNSNYVDQIVVQSTGNYPSLRLGTYDAYDAVIATTGNDLRILAGLGVYTEDHNIRFYTSFNGGTGGAQAYERMRINHSGNVLIGTASTCKGLLRVAGDAEICKTLFFNGGDGVGGAITNAGAVSSCATVAYNVRTLFNYNGMTNYGAFMFIHTTYSGNGGGGQGTITGIVTSGPAQAVTIIACALTPTAVAPGVYSTGFWCITFCHSAAGNSNTQFIMLAG